MFRRVHRETEGIACNEYLTIVSFDSLIVSSCYNPSCQWTCVKWSQIGLYAGHEQLICVESIVHGLSIIFYCNPYSYLFLLCLPSKAQNIPKSTKHKLSKQSMAEQKYTEIQSSSNFHFIHLLIICNYINLQILGGFSHKICCKYKSKAQNRFKFRCN